MKNLQNGFLRLFIIVVCTIFIIGLIAIVFLYWQTHQALNEARQNSYQNEPTPTSLGQTSMSPSPLQIYSGQNFSIQYPSSRYLETDNSNPNYQVINFRVHGQLNDLLGVIVYKEGFTSADSEIHKFVNAYGSAEVSTGKDIVAGIGSPWAAFKVSGISMNHIYVETGKNLFDIRSIRVQASQFSDFYKSFKLTEN